jgi:hypothetical protein
MKKLIYQVIVIVLFAGVCFSQNAGKDNLKPVEIAGAHLQHVFSKIVNQEYDLYINLPGGYKDSTKTFPVLYLVDGQWDFTLGYTIYGQQFYDGFVPEMVIVGITWGGNKPNYDQLRGRDLTPTQTMQQQPSGNATKFLESIRKEIIPFVESKYRVNKDRGLWGSSYGGLFTIYAMLTETDLFNRYFLTSPSLQYDNQLLFKLEESYYEKHKELNARVYMAMGGLEYTQLFQKFCETLKGRNYKGLEFDYKIVDGMAHSGTKAEGFARGIKFVYEKPNIKVDVSILKQYEGTYEFAPGMNMKIFLENDQLSVLSPDNSKFSLNAETDSDFFIKGAKVLVHFTKDDSGKVNGFMMDMNNSKRFIKKVN